MIVTLCGSVSYPELLRAAARYYALAGHQVLAPDPMGREVTPEEMADLTEAHHAKIRRADLVVIVPKPDESIGESVQAEAAYAKQIGKDVTYF